MLGSVGFLAGLLLLIVMALREVNIFIAALLCAMLVALSNGLRVPQALLEYFPFGSLDTFIFAGKFFVLFLCGAVFGKVVAASSIAQAITRSLGSGRILWVTMLVCAVLTYGGVRDDFHHVSAADRLDASSQPA